MKAILTIQIGDKTLSIEGEGDSKTIIKHMAFWSSLPAECGLCHSKDINLGHRSHEGNDFYEMRCAKCNATISFGQHKTGNTLFVKVAEGWSIYEGKKQQKQPDDKGPPPTEEEPF